MTDRFGLGAQKWEQVVKRGRVVKASNVHCIVVVDRGKTNPLVEVWTEDDENWFLSMAFDAFWLPELSDALRKIVGQIDKRNG